MQSVSPRDLMAVPGLAWERTRAAVPASATWSAILVFALVVTIARSTVAALWVPSGVDGIPFVALGAALMMSLLAVTPLPSWLCVSLGIVAGPVVSVMVSSSQFKLAHPDYPTGLGAVQVWFLAIYNGSAFGDQVFIGLVITLLMWVTGAWLAWCVVRWRKPLIGLIPGAAAFTTNVLNTNNQQGYTFIFLALTLGLLLWTTYTASVAKATAARIKMTGDARWDFWETGLVATAALLVVGIMLPPISTVDRTQTMESSLFQGWAQFQEKLNRTSVFGNGPGTGATASTGFSSSVSLGTQLEQSKVPVFTYTLTGGYPGPEYFRGINLSVIQKGPNGRAMWSYAPGLAGQAPFRTGIAAGDSPVYSEPYETLALATFTINMITPPADPNQNVLFYPGILYKTTRQSAAEEVWVPEQNFFPTQLATIDRLDAINPPNSKGQYNITVEYPNVTVEQLENAGTDYARWLAPYTVLPADARSAQVYEYIHQQALDITAGKTNPYDQASAIEAYLRDDSRFKYTLKPKVGPSTVDDLYYFLHDSHEGYCQYFAMAMGEMLRSLGIPTRLVSGFGPGTYDDIQHRDVVRDEDAHVWVESYFPNYGWIPFEPTNDNFYHVIPRGSSSTGLCLRDNNCTNPVGLPATAPTAAPGTPRIKDPGATGDEGATPVGSPLRFLDPSTITRILGVLGALVLLLVALGFRYLRPRTVMGVWRRVLVLSRLAGAEPSPGETPLELDQRLGRAFPEAAPHLHTLTDSFVVAAYAPPEMAEATKPTVMEAWASLRPMMVRRVFTRIRPGRS